MSKYFNLDLKKKYIFVAYKSLNTKIDIKMKKSLLTIGLLTAYISMNAQVLTHVDNSALLYVSPNTLVYNGGGLQTKGSGMIDNRGNIMIQGSGGDVVKTIAAGASTADKTDGGNIVLRANDYSSVNPNSYGQLYISGLSQGNITGIVSKEFKAERHGNGNYFQQIALPFYNKVLSSLSTEFGKTFGVTRWTQNEILKFNNVQVVSHNYTSLNDATSDPTGYYMLGSNNNNLKADTPPASLPTITPTPTGSVYTLHGKPYAEVGVVTLQNAGVNINFGPNGSFFNSYGETYNSYLQDQFEATTSAWAGTFGRNIYQFGNPYFTNLDLSKIGYTESTTVTTDANAISNIWGVRYSPGTVTTLANGSTYSTNALVRTFSTSGIPAGDVGLIIKPMQAFVIKLRNNNSGTLNFDTTRRFNNTVRSASTGYSVTANKNAGGTLKQLGVIALDAAGKEMGRAYYVVSSESVTGHQTSIATTVQAANSSANVIGTFEEDPINGMFDSNYTGKYWLYINEANEQNFFGKYVPLALYNSSIASLKFEIRENAELIPSGQHSLSSGKGFYYKSTNGNATAISQDMVIPVSSMQYGLSYGTVSGTLSTIDQVKPSRTVVVYNPAIDNYIMQFDPNWKKAEIKVYDMSGKLVIAKDNVSTAQDFVIELDKTKSGYIVTGVSDSGEKVNVKILR